jgi:hypothetical protein
MDFFGVFLSLYSVLVAPWLADQTPSLVAAAAPIPAGIIIAFIVGLIAEVVGSVLLAIPFIRAACSPAGLGTIVRRSAAEGGRERHRAKQTEELSR